MSEAFWDMAGMRGMTPAEYTRAKKRITPLMVNVNAKDSLDDLDEEELKTMIRDLEEKLDEALEERDNG